jgi:quinolinate synthase
LWERVRVRGTSHYMSIPEVKDEKLINDILKLKEEKKAIILAHNYQIGEVQDIADFVGDSLDLSQKAAQTQAEVIVFCGVHFMAETAKILSPDKTVLMPDINAGCAMANMITLRQLKEMKKKYPEAVVVSYVNTTAEIKAESDYCCTSANAVKVVQTIPLENEILFIPDKYLGDYVSKQANRKMILWEGYCPTHRRILAEDILKKKAQYPKAEVLVHPECTPDVIAMADKVLSTSGICRYAKESNSEEFIIGTEIGILHRLKKENPDKKFYPASILSDCPNMKLTNLEKILWSLEDMIYRIEVPPDIAQRAKRSIDRMLEII